MKQRAVTLTEYTIEGLDISDVWRPWYVSKPDGTMLNPTCSFKMANELYHELLEMIQEGKSGWKAARMLKYETTRCVLVQSKP